MASRSVPISVQSGLFAELDAALSSFPSVRSADWRGEGARGGAKLQPKDTTSAQTSRTPIAALATTAAKTDPQQKAVPGKYWSEINTIAGPQAAAAVQRWLMRYVEGLSMDEIEMLATHPVKKS